MSDDTQNHERPRRDFNATQMAKAARQERKEKQKMKQASWAVMAQGWAFYGIDLLTTALFAGLTVWLAFDTSQMELLGQILVGAVSAVAAFVLVCMTNLARLGWHAGTTASGTSQYQQAIAWSMTIISFIAGLAASTMGVAFLFNLMGITGLEADLTQTYKIMLYMVCTMLVLHITAFFAFSAISPASMSLAKRSRMESKMETKAIEFLQDSYDRAEEDLEVMLEPYKDVLDAIKAQQYLRQILGAQGYTAPGEVPGLFELGANAMFPDGYQPPQTQTQTQKRRPAINFYDPNITPQVPGMIAVWDSQAKHWIFEPATDRPQTQNPTTVPPFIRKLADMINGANTNGENGTGK